MTREYTPGPWVADPPRKGTDHINVWEQCGIGHIAAVSTGLTPDPFGVANARLIAAAPDLLAALEHVKDCIGPWKDEPGCNCEDCMMLRPVHAAITKALGPDWQNEKSPSTGATEMKS